MKRSARAALLAVVVLAATACTGGHKPGPHATGVSSLPKPVRKQLQSYVRAARHSTADTSVQTIEVYGPGSRTALVRASSGDVVEKSKGQYYLFVLHGHFICTDCSGPAGAKPPHGTIETYVWSPTAGGTDFGIANSLTPAISSLHRLALMTLG